TIGAGADAVGHDLAQKSTNARFRFRMREQISRRKNQSACHIQRHNSNRNLAAKNRPRRGGIEREMEFAHRASVTMLAPDSADADNSVEQFGQFWMPIERYGERAQRTEHDHGGFFRMLARQFNQHFVTCGWRMKLHRRKANAAKSAGAVETRTVFVVTN